MKKIAFLMLIISVIFTVISCSGSSGGDQEKGYVDPGDWTGKDVNLNKAHNVIGENCSGDQCSAIIYQNRLNNIDYVGIAVDNFDNSTGTSRMKFKLYWEASSIPQGAIVLNSSQYNVRLVANGKAHLLTDGANINIDIDYNSTDKTYDIDITSSIVFTDDGGRTLNFALDPDIRAVKYP